MKDAEPPVSSLPPRWWHQPVVVWILILSLGPLALPFLFLSPQFSRKAKWGITTGVLVLTYPLVLATQKSLLLLRNELLSMNEVMPFLTTDQLAFLKSITKWCGS